MSKGKFRCKSSLHFIQRCYDSSTLLISKSPFKSFSILVLIMGARIVAQ